MRAKLCVVTLLLALAGCSNTPTIDDARHVGKERAHRDPGFVHQGEVGEQGKGVEGPAHPGLAARRVIEYRGRVRGESFHHRP